MTQTKIGIARLAAGALSVCLALTGCGGSNEPQTVTGHVSADALVSSVSLKDSSVPTNERTSAADADGTFSFDVNGLTPPFTLTAVDAAGTTLQALAKSAGQTNVDALTTIAVSMAGDNLVLGASSFDDGYESMLRKLRTVLAPLFSHYGVKFGDDVAESRAFRAMLKEVTFDVTARTLTVTNKATGGVIFTAPLSDLSSGVLHPENIPGGTVTPPGACTYTSSAWGACQSNGTQTRTVTGAPAGCTGTPPASTQACTYVPPILTCTGFTYNTWTPAVCPTSGQQTRTVAISTPAGCTGGAPVLSQSCTPSVTCNAFTYNAWAPATCPANGQQSRTVATSSPAGCTGGAPVLSQACTYVPPVVTCTSFNYSTWGTCSASGQQTRTVTSSAPAGCTGGTPVLSQACTPPPVTCNAFTYNAWTPAVCPASGAQTRTVATSAPAGCTGGSPVVAQTCTFVPPPPDGAALYAAKCAGCHGPLATSTKAGRTAAQITAANMTQGLSAAEVQAVANALATVVPACTYTSGAWGACQVNGTQTRTVTAAPAGCTGTPPATTQACTYVPPVVTCTSFTYSAPTPAVCPSSGQQTRTVVSSSPAGCTGGTPVLTVACTYVPPASGATLYAAKCAGCHGSLGTSAKAGRTAAQITAANMTQGLSASDVQLVADALSGSALYASKCAGCHGPLATSAKAGRTAAQITAANMTQGLSAAEVQAVAAALATVATPPPATDGTALYNQYCSGCHGTSMKGKSASTIQSAINSVGQMSSLKSLTSAQIQAISTAR